MICPLDRSPCTGDHSANCHAQCLAEIRRIPKVPVTEFVKASVSECPDCGHVHYCGGKT